MINKRLANISYMISPLLVAACTSMVTTLTMAQIPTLPQQPIPADIQQAISNIMKVNYSSNYDKVRGCTLFNKKETSHYEGGKYVTEDNYCIAPINYEIKEINGQTRLYLLASGYVYDGKSGNAYPGIGGLFELYKMGNSWVVSASNPFIYSGGSGRSQLYQFELLEVGKDKYGWTGKHCGSGAGGQSSCLWTMYAAMKDGRIKTVAEIDFDYYSELISENTYYEGTGYVSHDNNAPMTDGFYPLDITLDIISGRLGHYGNNSYANSESEEKSTYAYNKTKQQFELIK